MAMGLAGEIYGRRQVYRVRGLTFPPFHFKIAHRTNFRKKVTSQAI